MGEVVSSNFHSAIDWEAFEGQFSAAELQRLPPPVENISSQPWIDVVYLRMLRRNTVKPFCESPIEADFAIALIEAAALKEIEVIFTDEIGANLRGPLTLVIVPQLRLDRYRFDFALIRGSRAVLIECDGKQFHSSAKQQANDRRKDSLAMAKDIKLLRFSGSELFRSSGDCALRAIAALEPAA